MSRTGVELGDEDRRRLANYIRNRRHELGWHNTREFAQAAHVSAPTISAVETGKNVRANSLALIENALGWKPGSTDEILAGGEPITDAQPAPSEPVDERPVGADEVRQLVQILFDRYDDPDTPEPERLMIRGTLAELARLAEQNAAAGHRRDRTSA